MKIFLISCLLLFCFNIFGQNKNYYSIKKFDYSLNLIKKNSSPLAANVGSNHIIPINISKKGLK